MAWRRRRRRPLSTRPEPADWPAWPQGVGRRILTETDSSNAEAQRIASGLAGPEWILALRQTAARGRRGRAWVMPPGNFAATYVTRMSEPPPSQALRSFVAALALFDALAGLTGRTGALALKWPNDVLLNGGKVAGILLESFSSSGTTHLAIGFGVNLAQAPLAGELEPDAARPVSVAGETGVQVGPADLLARLAPAFARWEHLLTTQGFAPVRDAWLARATRLGAPITARVGTRQTHGIFETVDSSGALVLATEAGRQAIPAADIYF